MRMIKYNMPLDILVRRLRDGQKLGISFSTVFQGLECLFVIPSHIKNNALEVVNLINKLTKEN
jgi:hypothetical protein